MPQQDPQSRPGEVEAIGKMLAEAFIARIERFTPTDRIRLLESCREVLVTNPDIASIFFK